MLYYLALVWNDHDSARRDTAQLLLRRFHATTPNWSIAVEQPGLAVFYRRPLDLDIDEPYVLHNRGGVVLGKLFNKSYAESDETYRNAPEPVIFDESCSAKMVRSEGRLLIERYWGQYIAFLKDSHLSRGWVLRDPGGRIPCEWIRYHGVDIYFVRFDDCERLIAPSLSVNRRYLLGYMTYGNVCVRQTGLNEVETVLPGECIKHDGDLRTHTFYWNPIEIAETDVIEDPAEAARLLRRTVRACVHAWASCFNKIMLKLSGGLDSSIVASCLVDAPLRPSVLCQNLYSSAPSMDERKYARLVSERFGFELIEKEAEGSRYSFIPISDIRKSLYPYPWWLVDSRAGQEEADFSSSRGIEVQFTGDGGDELFMTATALPGTVDYLWRNGISLKLFSKALSDAAADNLSVWEVLRLAYHYGFRKQAWHMRNMFDAKSNPLLLPEAQADAYRDRKLWHPLYREVPRIPRSKFSHAYSLTFGTTSGYVPCGVDHALIAVAPLKSQPVLELSLRIPVYILRYSNQNRALARRAFFDDLPKEIVLRSTKALGTSELNTIFFDHIAFVREMLVEGFLVREGFVDRTKLESVLSGQLNRIQSHIFELGVYLDVEAWIRSWSQDPRRAAA